MLKKGVAVGSTQVDECVDVAVQAATLDLAEYETWGCQLNDGDQAQRQSLVPRIQKGVRSYIKAEPIPTTWRVLDVEQDLGPDAGNCRVDLGALTPHGPTVCDLKTKLTIDPKYRARDIQRYRDDPQLLHYCHFAAERYQVGQILRYYVILVGLEPKFEVELIPFDVRPEILQMWYQSAKCAWQRMEWEDFHRDNPDKPTNAIPIADFDRCGDFGGCEMARACHDHLLDEHAMRTDYVKPQREGQ
jgi:hypothetical protein